MGDVFRVRVVGVPVAWGRPRVQVRHAGGYARAHVFQRAADRVWQRDVLVQVLAVRPPVPLLGPVRVGLDFWLPRPPSLPRRVTHPRGRPDLDNLAKSILDAVRGVLFRDDGQVVELHATKAFDASPGVTITVHGLD